MTVRRIGTGMFGGSLRRWLSAFGAEGAAGSRFPRTGVYAGRRRAARAHYLEVLEQRQLLSVFHLSGSGETGSAGLDYQVVFSTTSGSLESWTVQWGDGSNSQTFSGGTHAVSHTFASQTLPIITATAVDGAGLHVVGRVPGALLTGSPAGRYVFAFEAASDGTVDLGWTNASNSGLISTVTAWTQAQALTVGAGLLYVQATVPGNGVGGGRVMGNFNSRR